MKKITAISLFGLLTVSGFSVETTSVIIGTGGVTGNYYPTGGAICKLVNRNKKTHGVKCSVESTGGSIYNLNALRAGELQLGLAQSDWQYHAYKGTSKFKSKGAFKDLRTLFSVHNDSFTLVARKDANIKTFDDLKGKRVNIGNPGSGQRGTMESLMEAKGWDRSVFKLASELKPAEQSKALCDNKIDAMVFTVGHPSGTIKEATTTCNSAIINLDDSIVKKFVKDNKYYSFAKIPGKMYRGNPNEISTFGPTATFVTTSKLSDKAAYVIVKAVFDNFEIFKKLHPAYSQLKKENMIKDGLNAPLHPGAIKYYKEVGLLK